MYSDPLLDLLQFKAHQRELERKLEFARLLREARAGNRRVLARLLLGAADLLIGLGWALKRRYEAESLDRFPGQSIGLVASQAGHSCHLLHQRTRASSSGEPLELPFLGMSWEADIIENVS